MRSTTRSNASFFSGEEEEEATMSPKSVVPVSAFHPASLLRISSAREMWRSLVDEDERRPALAT